MVCHTQNLEKQVSVNCYKITYMDLMPKKPKGDCGSTKVMANLGTPCIASGLGLKDAWIFLMDQMWTL